MEAFAKITPIPHGAPYRAETFDVRHDVASLHSNTLASGLDLIDGQIEGLAATNISGLETRSYVQLNNTNPMVHTLYNYDKSAHYEGRMPGGGKSVEGVSFFVHPIEHYIGNGIWRGQQTTDIPGMRIHLNGMAPSLRYPFQNARGIWFFGSSTNPYNGPESNFGAVPERSPLPRGSIVAWLRDRMREYTNRFAESARNALAGVGNINGFPATMWFRVPGSKFVVIMSWTNARTDVQTKPQFYGVSVKNRSQLGAKIQFGKDGFWFRAPRFVQDGIQFIKLFRHMEGTQFAGRLFIDEYEDQEDGLFIKIHDDSNGNAALFAGYILLIVREP